ncbi:GNAT family N-acetyltransferase [Paenibacillus sp. NPDC058071]|uniref:GNAT family N-acetyltransferase n=1 Tax=Paenibacillus sp. NPDC058071 TaxID=3346326 RepID=UPI0036DF9715
MSTQQIALKGTRAGLYPMEEEHAERLLEAGQDPAIWNVFMEPLQTIEDVLRYIRKAKQQEAAGTCLPFVIADLNDNRIVGSTRFFDLSVHDRGLEIGHTWLHPSVWRTRINTECKYLLLRDAFERLDMLRVQLKADSRNARSLAAIERLGAVKEGVLRNHRVLHDGYVRDTVMYSITKQEWPQVKAHLERLLQ